jgi:uncharacterized protein YecT (DUF1311 family)
VVLCPAKDKGVNTLKYFIFSLTFCVGGFLATPAAFSQSQLCQDSVTTPDIVECLASHLNLMDGDLNRTYQELRAGLNKTDYAKLLKAQRGWIKFRDAECARIADYASGGTMAPILKLGCLMKLTERRIADLSTNPLTGEVN